MNTKGQKRSTESKILVTGGAGYIGSHTVLELAKAGHAIVVLDNYSNSSPEVILRLRTILERENVLADIEFIEGDIRDGECLDQIFVDHSIQMVVHFAGLKAVGESVAQPLRYYENNVYGTLVLLQSMARANVKRLVFSSSATVYGADAEAPLEESMPRGNTTNPYGTTKAAIEKMLEELSVSDPEWSVALLRYFNPVGAHRSGLIGEDPNGIPNNLMPFISQVAIGKLTELSVFGGDYPTSDGTGVRDYLHVTDLAKGHVSACRWTLGSVGVGIWNLGTGRGYSVLEMVAAFERISGASVPFKIVPRRVGDVAVCYAEPQRAEQELGWRAEEGLDEMIRDAWNWQSHNPNGYRNG